MDINLPENTVQKVEYISFRFHISVTNGTE